LPEPGNCKKGCHIATEFVTIIYDRFPIIPIKTREKSWIPRKVFRLRKKFQWEERCRSSQKFRNGKKWNWNFWERFQKIQKLAWNRIFPEAFTRCLQSNLAPLTANSPNGHYILPEGFSSRHTRLTRPGDINRKMISGNFWNAPADGRNTELADNCGYAEIK